MAAEFLTILFPASCSLLEFKLLCCSFFFFFVVVVVVVVLEHSREWFGDDEGIITLPLRTLYGFQLIPFYLMARFGISHVLFFFHSHVSFCLSRVFVAFTRVS